MKEKYCINCVHYTYKKINTATFAWCKKRNRHVGWCERCKEFKPKETDNEL